jgi:hypothetical protein
MKIGLYNNTPDKIVGCRKLILNLKKGLEELGIEYLDNQLGDMNGCVHGAVRELQDKSLPPETLIGVEIMVLPSDMPDLWIKYRNWVQPSDWVCNYMKTFPDCAKTKMYSWPVGIDHDEFKTDRGPFKRDCFIYYKNVTKQTPIEKLNYVKHELDNRKMRYEVLTYGNYKEEEFKELCETSLFCVWLVGTESQNIAIMEAMAMGIPLYVIDEKQFEYYGYKFRHPSVSSAPYFSDKCGIKADDMSRIDEFRDRILEFWPRDYIEQNHTCKHGAQKYIDILRKCHNDNH